MAGGRGEATQARVAGGRGEATQARVAGGRGKAIQVMGSAEARAAEGWARQQVVGWFGEVVGVAIGVVVREAVVEAVLEERWGKVEK